MKIKKMKFLTPPKIVCIDKFYNIIQKDFKIVLLIMIYKIY